MEGQRCPRQHCWPHGGDSFLVIELLSCGMGWDGLQLMGMGAGSADPDSASGLAGRMGGQSGL